MTTIIGILALQGAFIEHQQHLDRLRSAAGLDVETRLVKTVEDLERCNALVIPGGESTVQLSLAARTPGFLELFKSRMADPTFPVWGTCAGMILMADEDGVAGGRKARQPGLGAVQGMRVWRNAYGSQLESFEIPLEFKGISRPDVPFPGIFIRAPALHSIAAASAASSKTPIEPLCILPASEAPPTPPDDSPLGPADLEALRVVALRQGKKLACSFHPELSKDLRVHEYFVRQMVLA